MTSVAKFLTATALSALLAASGSAWAQQGQKAGGGQGVGHGAASGKRVGEQGGHKGGRSIDDVLRAEESEEDSDRPAWAGPDAEAEKPSGMGGGKPATAGTPKGDLYGDLYIIVRDENGVPILTEDGYVQAVAADGTIIPLNEEGDLVDPEAVVELELGRINLIRAGSSLLDSRLSEGVTALETADDLALDPAGRLMVLVDGQWSTIDAPPVNLALYYDLVGDGDIDGLELPTAASDEFSYLTDGEVTRDDLLLAASLLATGMDKTGTISIDEVYVLNEMLDVTSKDLEYVDFSALGDYEVAENFDGTTASVLVQQPDGSFVAEEVLLTDVVTFEEVDRLYDADDGPIDFFSQAVEDANNVIEFIHEYAVPVTTTAVQ